MLLSYYELCIFLCSFATAIEIFLSDVKPHNGNIWCNAATDYIYGVKSSIILFINSSSFLRSFVYEISIQFQHCRLSSALYLYDIHIFSFHVCMPYLNPWIIPSTDTLYCIYFLNWVYWSIFFHSLVFFSSIFWSVDDDEDGKERKITIILSQDEVHSATVSLTLLLPSSMFFSLNHYKSIDRLDWKRMYLWTDWLFCVIEWNYWKLLLKIMLWTSGREIR
jgi:hypothetical protein